MKKLTLFLLFLSTSVFSQDFKVTEKTIDDSQLNNLKRMGLELTTKIKVYTEENLIVKIVFLYDNKDYQLTYSDNVYHLHEFDSKSNYIIDKYFIKIHDEIYRFKNSDDLNNKRNIIDLWKDNRKEFGNNWKSYSE